MKHFKFKKLPLVMSLFIFGLIHAQQEITVSGTVQDGTTPMPGVNVFLQNEFFTLSCDFGIRIFSIFF